MQKQQDGLATMMHHVLAWCCMSSTHCSWHSGQTGHSRSGCAQAVPYQAICWQHPWQCQRPPLHHTAAMRRENGRTTQIHADNPEDEVVGNCRGSISHRQLFELQHGAQHMPCVTIGDVRTDQYMQWMVPKKQPTHAVDLVWVIFCILF